MLEFDNIPFRRSKNYQNKRLSSICFGRLYQSTNKNAHLGILTFWLVYKRKQPKQWNGILSFG